MRTPLATDCWLLHLRGGYTLAISLYQVAELINNPIKLAVPQTPTHCNHLIPWRDTLIPLVDYQDRSINTINNTPNNAMVVKFLGQQDNIHYLAFAVTGVEKSCINDADFTTPQNQELLPFSSSILSASQNQNQVTYILDMQHLYENSCT